MRYSPSRPSGPTSDGGVAHLLAVGGERADDGVEAVGAAALHERVGLRAGHVERGGPRGVGVVEDVARQRRLRQHDEGGALRRGVVEGGEAAGEVAFGVGEPEGELRDGDADRHRRRVAGALTVAGYPPKRRSTTSAGPRAWWRR